MVVGVVIYVCNYPSVEHQQRRKAARRNVICVMIMQNLVRRALTNTNTEGKC